MLDSWPGCLPWYLSNSSSGLRKTVSDNCSTGVPRTSRPLVWLSAHGWRRCRPTNHWSLTCVVANVAALEAGTARKRRHGIRSQKDTHWQRLQPESQRAVKELRQESGRRHCALCPGAREKKKDAKVARGSARRGYMELQCVPPQSGSSPQSFCITLRRSVRRWRWCGTVGTACDGKNAATKRDIPRAARTDNLQRATGVNRPPRCS